MASSFNKCMRMVPLVRLAAAPAVQPARTLFSPWPRTADIGALIRDMDRQMDRLERQLFRGMPSLFARAGPALPIDHTVEAVDGQYRVSMDLAGFRPEEVSLALDEKGRRLTVSAKCDRQHRDGSRFAQELSRTITLPESIDTERLTSLLHRDGVLAIEAPFKEQHQPQVEQREPHSIPITRKASTPELEQKEAEKAESSST